VLVLIGNAGSLVFLGPNDILVSKSTPAYSVGADARAQSNDENDRVNLSQHSPALNWPIQLEWIVCYGVAAILAVPVSTSRYRQLTVNFALQELERERKSISDSSGIHHRSTQHRLSTQHHQLKYIINHINYFVQIRCLLRASVVKSQSLRPQTQQHD
jgi:hypothetical protein